MSPNAPVVMGIDTSLTASGVASSDYWCRVVGKKNVTTLPVDRRAAAMDEIAAEILALVDPATALVLVEAPSAAMAYGGASERAYLTWRVISLIGALGIPVTSVAPSTLKLYATGTGQASKSLMVEECARKLPAFTIGGNDNAADAAWLAAMGRDWLGHPLAALPKAQRAALTRVNKKKKPIIEWPVPAAA